MASNDQPASFEPKPSASQEHRRKPASGAADPSAVDGLVAIMVDLKGGRIVRIEYAGPAGDRHELSREDTARLAGDGPDATLQRLVEQAFQAGIDCVLGSDAEDEQGESKQDADISQALLRSLIETSPVTRLMKREVLDRAIIGTLIRHAADAGAEPPRSAAAH
jgi:hypothetical protein